MGEYANYAGHRIKVGTCEDMYYLRADQVRKITESESDFNDPEVLAVVRFRFPWPDEDANAPGDFEDAFRSLTLWDFEQPADLEHGLVQFSASNGYLVSLPCPEGSVAVDHPYHVGRNGYGGPASLMQQAWRGGRLVGIARCNGCEAVYRLEDGTELAAAASIRSAGDKQISRAIETKIRTADERGDRLHLIADRLLAGYELKMVQDAEGVS